MTAKIPSAMDYEQIVEALFEARRAGELTQAELARRLEVVPSTVGNWEQGTNDVPSRKLPALAQALGFDLLLVPDPDKQPRAARLLQRFLAAPPHLQEAALAVLAIRPEAKRDSA